MLSMLGASLTLPGIAGIVLTVGMAVDANVLIFERIREELAAGTPPQARDHDSGYEKALSSIADANITTLIAAIVLFGFGTGPIKGFAITLTIGIVTSMFTAIVGTRAIVNLAFGGRKPRRRCRSRNRDAPDQAKDQHQFPRRDAPDRAGHLGRRRHGVDRVAVERGLDFGIDFTGGVLLEVGYEEAANLEEIRTELANAGFDDAQVQLFGAATDVLVRLPPQPGAIRTRFASSCRRRCSASGKPIDLRRVETVSPQVGANSRSRAASR